MRAIALSDRYFVLAARPSCLELLESELVYRSIPFVWVMPFRKILLQRMQG